MPCNKKYSFPYTWFTHCTKFYNLLWYFVLFDVWKFEILTKHYFILENVRSCNAFALEMSNENNVRMIHKSKHIIKLPLHVHQSRTAPTAFMRKSAKRVIKVCLWNLSIISVLGALAELCEVYIHSQNFISFFKSDWTRGVASELIFHH